MSGKKYWIETYGCQMNFAESDAMEIELKKRGWSPADSENEADAVILNTCSVRESAETRIWGRLGRFSALKKERDVTLAVTGCMAERLKDKIIDRCKDVDVVSGNFHKNMLYDFLDNGDELPQSDDQSYEFSESYTKGNGFSAFIPIMHGCNNFCTYCIVPYVRGREVSRNPKLIVDEINKMDSLQEVMLLGQNVNSYDYEYEGRKMDFPDLLEFIIKETDVKWIRFMSPHPKDFSDKLIDVIRDNPRICRNIHLPLQHGSDKILKLMNRKYDFAKYCDIAKKLRAIPGGLTLSTDLMIGFPGEDEQDFQATLDAVRKIKFDDAFTYYYNKREGTKACEMDGHLSDALKKERLAQLIDVHRECAVEQKRKKLGATVTALAESVSKKNSSEILARSEQNFMIVYPGSESDIGKFVTLKLVELSGTTFKGVVVDENI